MLPFFCDGIDVVDEEEGIVNFSLVCVDVRCFGRPCTEKDDDEMLLFTCAAIIEYVLGDDDDVDLDPDEDCDVDDVVEDEILCC